MFFMLTKTAFIWLWNTMKTVIFWKIITFKNNCFLYEYILKCHLYLSNNWAADHNIRMISEGLRDIDVE